LDGAVSMCERGRSSIAQQCAVEYAFYEKIIIAIYAKKFPRSISSKFSDSHLRCAGAYQPPLPVLLSYLIIPKYLNIWPVFRQIFAKFSANFT